MKSYHYFLVSAICYFILFFELTYFKTILTHPYMIFLMFVLFGIGGYCFGRGLGKIKNE